MVPSRPSVTLLAGVSSIGSSFASSSNLMPQGSSSRRRRSPPSIPPSGKQCFGRCVLPRRHWPFKKNTLASRRRCLCRLPAAWPKDMKAASSRLCRRGLDPRKMAAAFALRARQPGRRKPPRPGWRGFRSKRGASLPRAAEERFARLPGQAVPVLGVCPGWRWGWRRARKCCWPMPIPSPFAAEWRVVRRRRAGRRLTLSVARARLTAMQPFSAALALVTKIRRRAARCPLRRPRALG